MDGARRQWTQLTRSPQLVGEPTRRGGDGRAHATRNRRVVAARRGRPQHRDSPRPPRRRCAGRPRRTRAPARRSRSPRSYPPCGDGAGRIAVHERRASGDSCASPSRSGASARRTSQTRPRGRRDGQRRKQQPCRVDRGPQERLPLAGADLRAEPTSVRISGYLMTKSDAKTKRDDGRTTKPKRLRPTGCTRPPRPPIVGYAPPVNFPTQRKSPRLDRPPHLCPPLVDTLRDNSPRASWGLPIWGSAPPES